jgi:hypothetical protein
MSGSEPKADSRSQVQDIQNETGLNKPPVWTVIFVCILAISFFLVNIKASWDSSTITLIINVVLVVILACFVASIASWSFVRSDS